MVATFINKSLGNFTSLRVVQKKKTKAKPIAIRYALQANTISILIVAFGQEI